MVDEQKAGAALKPVVPEASAACSRSNALENTAPVVIRNASVTYQNDKTRLHDVNLTVAPGEVVLLAGASGSGKSTLINSINGLAFAYDGCTHTGEIVLCGKPITELKLYEVAALLANVFQNPKTHFFNVDTTMELLFHLENLGTPLNEMQKRLKHLLEVFPIQHLLGRSIFELSGGEKQILCVAAAYISGVQTLILDEPSSNLDAASIDVLETMLLELKRQGVTLIIAEHRLYYVMDVVDTVYVVQDGKIAQRYTRDEFCALSKQDLHARGLRGSKREPLTLSAAPHEGQWKIDELTIEFSSAQKKPFDWMMRSQNSYPKQTLSVSNLQLCRGSIYGIIGRNGIGKSSFVRALLGLEKTTHDVVSVDGRRVNKQERIKRSSSVFQDVNHQLFTDSVAQEINLEHKLSDDELNEILTTLGILELKDRHPMSLSGGEKQRVAIGAAFATNHDLICLDEPTSGMDYGNMMRISTLIKKYSRKDSLILIVSHDAEFLNCTADYLIDLETYSNDAESRTLNGA
ncbi:ABC transporter ATP-binding protein [Collinsella sp. AGMB00827]|uniref:ABC transporter ATP-binding protein n=1 Tax=Collinsella ureilytica TaxID=2869515 RepID=A0ABS7MK03_9ACTN|nr:ABC transporter ATP-binding protein [Collinsella urealyticum]MBY4797694.1 ABC transporter ATP-binding protein [Collinsella urealyticum]